MISALSPEALSQSPWILPAFAWLAAPIVLELAVAVRGFFRTWGLFFAVTTALDAWFTGPLSPVAAGSGLATFFAVLFVVVGDWRFFCAIEGLSAPAAIRGMNQWGRAAGLTLIVPLASQAFRIFFPELSRNARTTYLVYELLFLLVASLYGGLRIHKLRTTASVYAPVTQKVVGFFLLQYALWSGVDIFLLSGGSAYFHLVRVVPNLLYYVCFLPYVLAMIGRVTPAAAEVPSAGVAV